MGYQYFIQPEGPKISTSLFGDADRAGIDAGNAQKTQTQAIVEGTTKGIETGQQIAANYQAAQIRQNQIDQQPLQNKMDELRVANAEIANKAGTIDLNNKVNNETLQTQADAAKLQNETVKTTKETDLINRGTELSQSFGNMSPEEQSAALFNNQNADLFAANPKLKEQLAMQAAPNLSPQQRIQLDTEFNKKGVSDKYAYLKQQQADAYKKSEGALYASPVTGDLINKTGLSPEQIYSNTEVVEHGLYKTDANGKLNFDITTGKYATASEEDRKGIASRDNANKINSFDFVVTNPFTKERVVAASNVDTDTQKLFSNYSRDKSLQDGSAENSEKKLIDFKASQKLAALNGDNANGNQQPAPAQNRFDAQVDSVGGKQTPIQQVDPQVAIRQSIAKKNLNLDDSQVQKITPALENLHTFASRVVSSPTERNSPTTQLEQQNLVKSTARKISDDAFDSNETLRTTYSQSAVDQYNAAIRNSIGNKFSSGIMNYMDRLGARENNPKFNEYYNSQKDKYLDSKLSKEASSADRYKEGLAYDMTEGLNVDITPLLIQTPKDLYFVNNRTALEKGVTDTLVAYGQNQYKIQTAGAQAASASNSMKNRFAAAQNGR